MGFTKKKIKGHRRMDTSSSEKIKAEFDGREEII